MDASTPQSQILTQSPTATTLLGNASTSTGRWKPLTRHKTPLRAVEPLQQGRTPGRLGTMVRSTPLRKMTESCNLRNYESSKQSSTKIASALSCSNKSSSRTTHTRLAKVSADGLERCIGRSSETGNLSSPSAASHERARTSSQRRCCSAICPSCRTLKHGAFETRCRLYSK